jgi:hypothetical protein
LIIFLFTARCAQDAEFAESLFFHLPLRGRQMEILKHFVTEFQITAGCQFKTGNEFALFPKGCSFFPFCPLSRKEKEKKIFAPFASRTNEVSGR